MHANVTGHLTGKNISPTVVSSTQHTLPTQTLTPQALQELIRAAEVQKVTVGLEAGVLTLRQL